MSFSPDEVDARRLVRACSESLDAARALLDAEPHLLFARDGLGETALHYLAVENQLEAVQFLFMRGAALNTVSNVDGSPLSEAASLGYESLVEWLLANGAEIELPGQGEPTILNSAASGNAAIVSMLLAAGANPRTTNDLNETALHIAAASDERLSVTELLLEAGASVEANSAFGTPLEIAIQTGSVGTAALLRSRIAPA